MAIESQIITDSNANVAIAEWFEKLGKYCASVDYDSARAIFAEDVLSFGTPVTKWAVELTHPDQIQVSEDRLSVVE